MKRENKNAIISFILSIVLMVAIGILIKTFIHDSLDVEYIKRTYIHGAINFTAEKSETIAYALITVSFPIFFIAIYKILDKTKLDINSKIINAVICVSAIAIIALIVIFFFKWEFYSEKTLIKSNLILFIISLIVSIIGVIAYQKLENKKVKKIFKIILYILMALVILATGFMYINNSYAQTAESAHHFEAYFYPVYKVACGLTPGVDFNSLYGYYSYFFCFILNLLGGVSILKFSYIIAILIVICFACLAIFSSKLIKNKILWISLILASIFMLFIHGDLTLGYDTLQCVPHRLIFPMLMLGYILIYNKFREKYEALRKIGGVLLCTLRNDMELRNRSYCAWRLDNVSRI